MQRHIPDNFNPQQQGHENLKSGICGHLYIQITEQIMTRSVKSLVALSRGVELNDQ